MKVSGTSVFTFIHFLNAMKKSNYILIFFIAIFFLIWISFKTPKESLDKSVGPETKTETYSPIQTHVKTEPLEFNGYPCTEDCSGHEAGYDWAEENGIEDSDDCGGNSNSFIEGCESYVEENY